MRQNEKKKKIKLMSLSSVQELIDDTIIFCRHFLIMESVVRWEATFGSSIPPFSLCT